MTSTTPSTSTSSSSVPASPASAPATTSPPRCPGRASRSSRARDLRRHVGPVQVPRHPLGLRPAHLRLRVQAVGGEGLHRRCAQDPRLPAGDDGRERPRRQGALRPPGGLGRLVERGRPLDRAGGPRGRAHRAHRELGALRQRLLRLRPGLHARVRGPREVRRADRPPAVLARGPRLQRQEGRRHRLRRDRGDPGPVAADQRQAGRARHDAAAHADVHHAGAQAGPPDQRLPPRLRPQDRPRPEP